MFGNLFKKKTKKSSKDDDAVREEDLFEVKTTAPIAPIQSSATRPGESNQNDWTSPLQSDIDERVLLNDSRSGMNDNSEGKSKHTTNDVDVVNESVFFKLERSLQLSRSCGPKLLRNSLILIRITTRLLLRLMAAASLLLPFHGQMLLCIHFWTTIPAYEMYLC